MSLYICDLTALIKPTSKDITATISNPVRVHFLTSLGHLISMIHFTGDGREYAWELGGRHLRVGGTSEKLERRRMKIEKRYPGERSRGSNKKYTELDYHNKIPLGTIHIPHPLHSILDDTLYEIPVFGTHFFR